MAKVHSTPEWQRVRLEVLDRDLWKCRMCGILLRQGRKKPTSAVVDHIKPHELYEAGHYDPDNLRSVCKACHDGPCRSIEERHKGNAEAIQAAKLAYRPVGLDGYPVTIATKSH